MPVSLNTNIRRQINGRGNWRVVFQQKKTNRLQGSSAMLLPSVRCPPGRISKLCSAIRVKQAGSGSILGRKIRCCEGHRGTTTVRYEKGLPWKKAESQQLCHRKTPRFDGRNSLGLVHVLRITGHVKTTGKLVNNRIRNRRATGEAVVNPRRRFLGAVIGWLSQ